MWLQWFAPWVALSSWPGFTDTALQEVCPFLACRVRKGAFQPGKSSHHFKPLVKKVFPISGGAVSSETAGPRVAEPALSCNYLLCDLNRMIGWSTRKVRKMQPPQKQSSCMLLDVLSVVCVCVQVAQAVQNAVAHLTGRMHPVQFLSVSVCFVGGMPVHLLTCSSVVCLCGLRRVATAARRKSSGVHENVLGFGVCKSQAPCQRAWQRPAPRGFMPEGLTCCRHGEPSKARTTSCLPNILDETQTGAGSGVWSLVA